jgi:hypothetical protein
MVSLTGLVLLAGCYASDIRPVLVAMSGVLCAIIYRTSMPPEVASNPQSYYTDGGNL